MASEEADLQELLRAGDRAASRARDGERTEEQLRKAIRIYNRALELDPDNDQALNALSLGYFTLAEAYLEEADEKKAAYTKGYEFGLRSLRTNGDFDELYGRLGFAALKKIPDSVADVEALFWTGANLGRLAENEGVMDSLNDLPALLALNRRALELDETYLGGAPHRNLASIASEVLNRMPLTFWQVQRNGFSWEKAKEHFEKAIEIAPGCLENYLVYAQYYAIKRGKRELALELLEKVIEKPLGEKYPLVNEVAKEKARGLMRELRNRR